MVVKFCNGRYSFNEADCLGYGGFAQVFMGYDHHKKRKCALKIITNSTLSHQIMEEFNQQIKLMKLIRQKLDECPCQNIVQLYDFFQAQNKFVIVLQLCQGKTLKQVIITRHKIPEQQAVNILRQLCQGLVFLNQLNITHRDLKPENIFIKQGVYKIGDYGLSSTKSHMQTTLGTYIYMSPQVLSYKDYSREVDIWSLGIIFHQMLFGQLYFYSMNKQELVRRVLKQEYVIKQKELISQQCQDFLKRCVQKDPKNRLKHEQLLTHPIFKKQLKVIKKQLLKEVRQLKNFHRVCEQLKPYEECCRFAIHYLGRKGFQLAVNLFEGLKKNNNVLHLQGEQWKRAIQNKKGYGQIMQIACKELICFLDKFEQEKQAFSKYIKKFNQNQQNQILMYLHKQKQLSQLLFKKQLEKAIVNLRQEKCPIIEQVEKDLRKLMALEEERGKGGRKVFFSKKKNQNTLELIERQ